LVQGRDGAAHHLLSVTSAFFDALMPTPPGWLELARVMNATPGRILWRVRVPAAMPGF